MENDSITTTSVWYGTTTDSAGNSTWQPIPMGQPTAKDRDYEYDNWDEKPKERSNMRALYSIIVVNPKTEAIIGPVLVVAKDEKGALLKAGLPQNVRTNSEDYDFLIEHIGDVRAKKDVQKVKVVKEDDES